LRMRVWGSGLGGCGLGKALPLQTQWDDLRCLGCRTILRFHFINSTKHIVVKCIQFNIAVTKHRPLSLRDCQSAPQLLYSLIDKHYVSVVDDSFRKNRSKVICDCVDKRKGGLRALCQFRITIASMYLGGRKQPAFESAFTLQTTTGSFDGIEKEVMCQRRFTRYLVC
jgi:hypothetical protein